MFNDNYLTLSLSDQTPKTTVDDSDRASHVLAALHCIGSPALPEEIASKCEPFDGAATPELIRRLCSAPNSPVRLLESGLVTASTDGLHGAKVEESKRVSSVDPKTYFRKRKRNGLSSVADKRNQIEDTSTQEGKSAKDMVTDSSLLEPNARFPDVSVTKIVNISDVDGVPLKIILPKESSGFDHISHVKRETGSKLMNSVGVNGVNRIILPNNSIDSTSKNLGDKVQHNASPMEACFGIYSSYKSLSGHPLEDSEANFQRTVNSSSQNQPSKPFIKSKGTYKNFPQRRRALTELLEYDKTTNIPQKSDQKFLVLKDNCTRNIDKHKYEKESSLKVDVEQKELPQFEDYIIEGEEGSGGYGTVYRACRKSDGRRFAIKCPHAKAHKSHVNNELKMLERFGGRNFIVKYEGSLKNGDTECFILEHIDHDRHEVLKKEIDIFQLQWYGFCLFRALSFLHKQGVVHRDVKPGNFLFSRKLSKGVLIDFNLSVDLQHKHNVASKSKSSSYTSISHVPLPHPKYGLPTKDKVVTDNENKKSIKKNTNSTSLACPAIIGVNKLKSQGIDASTSTRTASTERTKEPLPSLGRKELISLVQDVMQSPNHDAQKTPVSQRKIIASPPVKILHTSPMPLFSDRVAIAGAGLLKNKGDCKQKREGPCFGTKGFRAPEVLFRSLFQSPKIDVWSAGVTILCLMIGRTPFTGEPEQNVKEIAKLRGSEDLWEVAKLHDRESSFPLELLDIRSLPAVELQSWCKAHTRRPEFFKHIPRSLFDLIDKCLSVNPRLRISAEEALQHNFFAPCHDSVMKRRQSFHMHNVC